MTTAIVAKPRFRRRTVLLGLAVAIVAAFAATLLVRRELAARRLAAVIAELDRTDPGWRFDDIERARPTIPEAENLAVVLATALAKLPPSATGAFGRADFLEPVPPNVRLTDAQLADARTRLARVAPAVPDMLALANFPRGRHLLEPDVLNTNLPHILGIMCVNRRGLQLLARVAVQDGDAEQALTVIRAYLNLGRSLRDEPFHPSPFLRGQLTGHAIRYLERLLGHRALSAEQLAAVRRELEAELADDPWPVLIRGQRACIDLWLNALRRGDIKPANARARGTTPRYSPTPVERVRDWFGNYVAPEVDTARAFALDALTRILATQTLPWPERKRAVEALCVEWAAGPEPARWWKLDDLPRDLTCLQLHQALLRVAVAAVAVEQYRVAHGDWPASLAAVGPLPDDPFTGKPLLMKRTAEGVTVYSVGSDLRDDGTLEWTLDFQPTDGDIGFRLYDVPHRNRPPAEGPP